jgi:hypothetical protein
MQLIEDELNFWRSLKYRLSKLSPEEVKALEPLIQEAVADKGKILRALRDETREDLIIEAKKLAIPYATRLTKEQLKNAITARLRAANQ